MNAQPLPVDAELAAWFDALERRANVPPARPRVPLVVTDGEGRHIEVGSVEPALGAALSEAGLPVTFDAGAWRVAAPMDATLAAVAHWLHARSLGGRWRDELLAVVDGEARTVGAIERAAVRPLGLATVAVHLVALAHDGRMWLQQRALDKATDPGLWDTTMGGLVAHGESLATTLERETWEEAGLLPGALQALRPIDAAVVRRPVPDGWMVERLFAWEARLPPGATPVNQDGEVARFEAVDTAELRRRLLADRFTLEAALVLRGWWLAPGPP